MSTEGYWTNLRQRRYGRRAVVRSGATGAAALMAAALVGCSSTSKTSGPAASTGAGAGGASGPKRGGNLREEFTSTNSIWDPYKTSSGAQLVPWGGISETMLALSPQTLKIEGRLIESWEVITPGVEYVLHVRRGIKYENKPPTNGRAFDAEDIVYNIKYAAGLLDPKNAGAIVRSSWYDGIKSVAAVDANTVSLKFSKPNAAILGVMADFRQIVIPREIPDKMSFNDFAKIPSIGPFTIKDYRDGESAQLVRNPAYWDQPRPYVDTNEIKWYADVVSANAAMLTGEIDILRVSGPQNINQVKNGKDVVMHSAPGRGHRFVDFNVKKLPDTRLWRAIHLIHDYKGNADAVEGVGLWDYSGPIDRVFPGALTSDQISKMPGWNPATKEADIAEGKKLFDAMGYPNGNGLTLTLFSTSSTGASFDESIRMQGNLKAAVPGLKFNVQAAPDSAAGQRALAAKDYEMVAYVYFEGPEVRLSAINFQTGGSRNYANYSNPKIDALIDKMFAESDQDMLVDLKTFQDELLKASPMIVPAGIKNTWAARSRVQGLKERIGPGDSLVTNVPFTERKFLWLDS